MLKVASKDMYECLYQPAKDKILAGIYAAYAIKMESQLRARKSRQSIGTRRRFSGEN